MNHLILDIDQNGRIDVLREFLAETIGFSLVFLHVPPGPIREELLRRFRGWSGHDDIPPLEEVHLAASQWPDEPLRTFRDKDLDRFMVVLTGLEQYALREGVSVALAQFNRVRDLLPNWIPGPLVIIASDDAMLSLRESAPDFMTWRGLEWSVKAVNEPDRELPPLPQIPPPVISEGSATIEELNDLLQVVLKRPHGDWEEASVRMRLGKALINAYRYAEGEAELTYAAHVFAKEGRTNSEAETLYWLGTSAFKHSDHETARKRFEEALALYEKVDETQGKADCIINLGDIASKSSKYEMARIRYEEALRLYRKVGDILGEANCIFRLGVIALESSEYETARSRFEEALLLYQRVGNLLGGQTVSFTLVISRSDNSTTTTRENITNKRYRFTKSSTMSSVKPIACEAWATLPSQKMTRPPLVLFSTELCALMNASATLTRSALRTGSSRTSRRMTSSATNILNLHAKLGNASGARISSPSILTRGPRPR